MEKFKLRCIDKINIGIFNNGGHLNISDIHYDNTVNMFRSRYDQLKKELGRAPTSTDFDNCPYMPSSRLMQRYFKEGVVGFRKFIGVKNTDLTKGRVRSDLMKEIFHRSKKDESSLFMEMYEKMNNDEVSVIREYCYQQWFDKNRMEWFSCNFCDIAIIKGDHVILIDLFNPADTRSLYGCVRTKNKKLEKQPIAFRPEVTYEVYFVCLNEGISQETIDSTTMTNGTAKVYALDTFKKEFLG